jgi:hypothetical protein
MMDALGQTVPQLVDSTVRNHSSRVGPQHTSSRGPDTTDRIIERAQQHVEQTVMAYLQLVRGIYYS